MEPLGEMSVFVNFRPKKQNEAQSFFSLSRISSTIMKPDVTSRAKSSLMSYLIFNHANSVRIYNVPFKKHFNIILPPAPSHWGSSIRSDRWPQGKCRWPAKGINILDIRDWMGPIKHSRKSEDIFNVKRLHLSKTYEKLKNMSLKKYKKNVVIYFL